LAQAKKVPKKLFFFDKSDGRGRILDSGLAKRAVYGQMEEL